MVRDFSIVLSVGIAVVFVVCLFVLNAILYERDRRADGPVAPLGRSRVERTLGRTHDITAGHPFLILAVAVFIAATGFVLDRRIPVESEPEKFIPPDSQVLGDLDRLSDLTATANTISFLVTAPDVTDPGVVKWMFDLGQKVIDTDGRVTGVNSLASLIAQGTPGGQPPDFTAASSPDFVASTPPDILRGFLSQDRRQASIVFTIRRDVPLIDQKSIIDEIVKASSPPAGVTAAPAGLGVLGVEAESRLTSHRTEMTLLALVAVLALLLAVTRNVLHAVIAVLPVAMVIGWTSAAMYMLRVPLNPMTSVAGPLVVALGTEFSVLLMLRYREERARGSGPPEAMATAYELSGRAIAASAFTVVGAFIALAFNDFPLLSQFGIVAVMGVLLSLAGAMLLMPPLLVWVDQTFASAVPDLEEARSS
jgi:hydrophobe/amphiphile efflux-3 (HAE3) family protein